MCALLLGYSIRLPQRPILGSCVVQCTMALHLTGCYVRLRTPDLGICFWFLARCITCLEVYSVEWQAFHDYLFIIVMQQNLLLALASHCNWVYINASWYTFCMTGAFISTWIIRQCTQYNHTSREYILKTLFRALGTAVLMNRASLHGTLSCMPNCAGPLLSRVTSLLLLLLLLSMCGLPGIWLSGV